MALTNCQECGVEVSDKASKCPNCGAPPTTMAKVEQVAWALSAIGVIVLIWALLMWG